MPVNILFEKSEMPPVACSCVFCLNQFKLAALIVNGLLFCVCFRWSVPMMMSITHRGTGVGLSGGNTSVFPSFYFIIICYYIKHLCYFRCQLWLTLKISSGHFSPLLLISAKSIYWHYKTKLFDTIPPFAWEMETNTRLLTAFSPLPGWKLESVLL